MTILGYVKDPFINPAKYTKFWVGLASAVLTSLTIAFTDNALLQGVIPFLGSLGVVAFPNKRS